MCPNLNTLRPRQDGRHFTDDIFACILFNENCCILIKFSLKYVRKVPIDNNPALIQIMAWRRSGDTLLSEPMMVSLLTHICVTRPQWVIWCVPPWKMLLWLFYVTYFLRTVENNHSLFLQHREEKTSNNCHRPVHGLRELDRELLDQSKFWMTRLF